MFNHSHHFSALYVCAAIACYILVGCAQPTGTPASEEAFFAQATTRAINAIQSGDAKGLLGQISETDRSRHDLNEEKLAGLLAILHRYTTGMKATSPIVKADSESAQATSAYMDGERVATLLSVANYRDSEPRGGTYVVYGIVYAAALAAGRNADEDLTSRRNHKFEAHAKGFGKLVPELKAIGLENVCNVTPDAPCRSIDEEAEFLDVRLNRILERP